MDVYLLPVGGGRFELYSEPDDHADPASTAPAAHGFWRRIVDRFRSVLAVVDREQDARASASSSDSAPPTLGQRAKARLLRWLAERVAEQRLLWHLRGRRAARLHRPADLSASDARRALLAILKRDADRHLGWLIVIALAFAASGLIAVLPGPNLIAYYLAFRLVGHYLSMRGARNGLSGIEWSIEPSEALGELGRLGGLPAQVRAERVRAIAESLGLARLPRFFARTTSPICREGGVP